MSRRSPVLAGTLWALVEGEGSWDLGMTTSEFTKCSGGFGASSSLSLGWDARHTWVPITSTRLVSSL